MIIEPIEPVEVVPGVLLRTATLDDAAALCEAHIRNREHLRRWDPRRADSFWTADGQRQRLSEALHAMADGGRALPMLLTAGDGIAGDRVVGVANLTGIAMGPARSATLGYWVDVEEAGRGIATATVERVCRIADEQLDLHRIQADTLLDNHPSQRVLAKCGFEQIGVARNYLHIEGRWQDLILHQRILNNRDAL